MTSASKYLLPSGLYDLLPPEAAFKRTLVNQALAVFERFGYAQVEPPLVEFEDSLLMGRGRTMSRQTFRLIDTASQRVMGIRPDLTLQTARIAGSRLNHRPLPLRLCYAGEVLWVKGSPLRGERQHCQAGAELVGYDSPEGDAEAIRIALDALIGMGAADLTVDLNLPSLIRVIMRETPEDPRQRAAIAKAVSMKDRAGLKALAPKNLDLLNRLIDAVGYLPDALGILEAAPLPEGARRICDDLRLVHNRLCASHPQVTLTLDPTENRGFEYHTGISFAIFERTGSAELARGGQYDALLQRDGEEITVRATGFSLYIGTLLRLLSPGAEAPRLAVPYDLPWERAAALQQQGYATVFYDPAAESAATAAARLGAGWWYDMNAGQIKGV